MKLIFCVALSLILCCLNVDAITIRVIKPGEQIKKSNEGGYETKLTDLDPDCLFLILERLYFDSLSNVAQMNEEFSSLAADVFHRKFSHKNFWVYYGFLFPNDPKELLNVADMEYDAATITKENQYFTPANGQLPKEYIRLEFGAQILNLFKHFGHLIKKITLPEVAGERSKLMASLISKYSSESLVDVTVDYAMENVLDYITKPLINVANVTLRFDASMETRQPIALNERFPALRRLRMKAFDAIRGLADFPYLIPHLEHVEIVGTSDEFKTFEGLISNNPQIRSLTLANIEPRHIQELNELLPQLETLALLHLKLNRERIRFENVTTLTIDYSYFGEMTSDANLEFPSLRTLRIKNYRSMHLANHVTFMKELNYLTHLHLAYSKITDSEFKQLTQNLTNLVELTLKCNNKVDGLLKVNAITEYVRSNDKLQRLNVIELFRGRELQQLIKQLGPEWKLSENGDALSFKRKLI